MEVARVDFVGVPTQDMERAIHFYVETLGLRQDEHREAEFWAGDTCLSLWKTEWAGREFAPNVNGVIALQVADVPSARAELEAKGVDFHAETLDTGVCHMAFFRDPDGNELMLHRRYKAYE